MLYSLLRFMRPKTMYVTEPSALIGSAAYSVRTYEGSQNVCSESCGPQTPCAYDESACAPPPLSDDSKPILTGTV